MNKGSDQTKLIATYFGAAFGILQIVDIVIDRINLPPEIINYLLVAIIIGFIGILVITEPGISSLNIYYVFPIIFCLGLSYVAIAIRQLSTSEPFWLISF